MRSEIEHIHHVGHVVHDMGAAMELYRRLGFRCKPPAYPMMAEREGSPPKPFGAANAHIDFARNFIEIVTVVRDGERIPDDAQLVPLSAPPEAMARIVASIRRTVATISGCLKRFEGTHILVLSTSDAGGTAARLERSGVGHDGVETVQRAVETDAGTRLVPVRLLELAGDAVPEGRLAIAENLPLSLQQAQTGTDHPNGAVELIEAILCVGDSELDAFVERYRHYTGREPHTLGAARSFELDGARVAIVPVSRLADTLPGESAPDLPGFAGYAVRVRDIAAARQYVAANGFPTTGTEDGSFIVPGSALLGTAVVFRQA